MTQNDTQSGSPVHWHVGSTVESLQNDLDSTDYAPTDLEAALAWERQNQDRLAAIEALEDAHDEATAGSDTAAIENPTVALRVSRATAPLNSCEYCDEPAAGRELTLDGPRTETCVSLCHSCAIDALHGHEERVLGDLRRE